MKYDESDNVLVRGSRVVTDRVGDAFGSVMNQSDMAQALAEIQKIDRNFDKEQFIRHCRFDIIPTVLEVGITWWSCECHVTCMVVSAVQAYVRGDLEVLKDWCHEAVSCALCPVVCSRFITVCVFCRHTM